MSDDEKPDNSALHVRILILLVLMVVAGGAGIWLGKLSVPREISATPSSTTAQNGVAVNQAPPDASLLDANPVPAFFYAKPSSPETWGAISEEVLLASRAGVHQYIVPLPLSWIDAPSPENPVAQLKKYIEIDAKATFMVQVSLNPPESWLKKHTTETMLVNGSPQNYPSASSQEWIEVSRNALSTLMETIEGTEVSKRLAGYILCGLVDDYWLQPSEYDRSEVNRRGFRDWLIRRYQNEDAVRNAWKRPDLKLADVDIPQKPDTSNSADIFFKLPEEQQSVDFLRFTSENTADALAALAAHVASNSSIKPKILAPYGFEFELASNASGHFALANLLESNLGGFISPVSAVDRGLGGVGGFMGPVNSLTQRGRMWYVIDDTRTGMQRNPDTSRYERMRGVRSGDIFDVQRRNFAAALVNGLGIIWSDPFGEGWLNDREQWDEFGNMHQIYTNHRPPPPDAPESIAQIGVNVVVDEESRFFQKCDTKLNALLLNGGRDSVLRSAVKTRFLLLRDVIEGSAPPAPVYLFLNAFRITSADRDKLHERLRREKACALWLYAPGYFDETASPENVAATVGMSVKAFDKPAKTGSVFIIPGQYLAEKAPIGQTELLNTLFYVNDPEADALAQYADSGKISIAVKSQPSDWTSVFIAEPGITPALFSELLRILEQPSYIQPGENSFFDAFFAGNGLLAIHASQAGKRAVNLGEFYDVQDLFDSTVGWVQKDGFLLPLRIGETRLFSLKPMAVDNPAR